MDKKVLQTYSTWAKENLENQIEVSLKALGINGDQDIRQAKRVGDVTTIEDDPTSYPADLYGKRESIINLVERSGYRNIIKEFAYTWFNRFVALRFMEVQEKIDEIKYKNVNPEEIRIIDKTAPRLIQSNSLVNAVKPPYLGGFFISGVSAA